MPNQCVRCKSLFKDGDNAILTGCRNCGGKLFFFIKQEKYDLLMDKKEEPALELLSNKDREQIEQDIYDLLGKEIDPDLPVVLDLETVNILEPGKFELDLAHLFNSEQPLVYRMQEGKYMIDLANSFRENKRV